MKQGGRYYYFAAEMFAQPLDANMRVALWSAATPEGPWRRALAIGGAQPLSCRALFVLCLGSLLDYDTWGCTQMTFTAHMAL